MPTTGEGSTMQQADDNHNRRRTRIRKHNGNKPWTPGKSGRPPRSPLATCLLTSKVRVVDEDRRPDQHAGRNGMEASNA